MAAIIYFLFIGSREIKFVTIKNRFPLFHKSDPAGYENRKIEFVRPYSKNNFYKQLIDQQ